MYKFLCDIYSEINCKIKRIFGILANVFAFSVDLESDFNECINKIEKLHKERNKFISNFKKDYVEYNRTQNNFSKFINANLKPTSQKADKDAETKKKLIVIIKEEYEKLNLKGKWKKINEKQKKIFNDDKIILESFPKTLENLLEYLRYTKLINDDKKQKYEQLLFDEENSIESLCKKKGKIV